MVRFVWAIHKFHTNEYYIIIMTILCGKYEVKRTIFDPFIFRHRILSDFEFVLKKKNVFWIHNIIMLTHFVRRIHFYIASSFDDYIWCMSGEPDIFWRFMISYFVHRLNFMIRSERYKYLIPLRSNLKNQAITIYFHRRPCRSPLLGQKWGFPPWIHHIRSFFWPYSSCWPQ